MRVDFFSHLQLHESFSFNTYVSAVNLDTTGGQSEGDYFTVTGWGLTRVSTFELFHYIVNVFSIFHFL